MGYLEEVQASTARTKQRNSGMSDLLSTLTRRQQQKQAAEVMQQMAKASVPPTGLSSSAPPVGSSITAKASTPSPKRVAGGGVDSWIQQALDVLKLDSS